MTKTVTVAVDGGPASNSAVEWASEWAKATSASVNLTAVVDLGWDPSERPDEVYQASYESALEEAARDLQRTSGGIEHTTSLRFGDPVKELVAASSGAGLFVVGTNKTGRITGMVRGTVPLRVAGSTRCPLVVVPVGWEKTGGHIVVGYEDDETSQVALTFAAREAVRMNEPLHIVHAWSVPATVAMSPGWMADEDFVSSRREVLDGAAASIRRTHPELDVRPSLQQGSAAEALVNESKNAALLVVGTHRRGVLAGLVLGSVSHDVLMNMPCPVAVVPHPDEPVGVHPEVVDQDLL